MHLASIVSFQWTARAKELLLKELYFLYSQSCPETKAYLVKDTKLRQAPSFKKKKKIKNKFCNVFIIIQTESK